MRLIMENRFSLFGLVALALAALFGIAFATQSVTVELGVSEPGTVRPERAVRVCPAPHETSDDDARSSVAAFAPRVSRDDDGELWAVPVPPAPEEDEAEEEDEDANSENGEDEAEAENGEGDDTENGEDEDAESNGDETDGERDLVGEELTEPGLVWSTDTTDVSESTAIQARDALASGLEAAQTTVSDDAVTEVRCAEPAIGTWFALPGGNDPEGVELDTLTAHLSNPADFRATASVDIYTADGPSYSPESRGIALGPGESFELDLTELVQNTPAIGVHVRTSTGRVAASLLAEHASGGTDWVNPAAPPAEEAVLPGVPGGDGVRRLLLAAPGDDPVEARVHVLTATTPEDDGEDEDDGEEGEEEDDGDGTGVPGDPRVVHVPPAASAWLTLESVLGGEPGTVVVEADGPVVAGVVAEVDGGSETAYTAAVEPLSLPLNTSAVLPDVPEGVETEVIVGSPERDTSVMATPIGAGGDQGDAVKVEIPAGTTHVFGPGFDDAWEPPPGIDPEDGYAVRLDLVAEGSGPVYVARVLRSENGMSVLPVRPAPVEVALPIVRDSMAGVTP